MDNITSGAATPKYTPASAMNDPDRFPFLYYPLYPDEFPITGLYGALSTYVNAGNDYDGSHDSSGPVLGSVSSSLQIALSARLKYVYYGPDGSPASPPAGSSPPGQDHLDLLVRTHLNVSADADNNNSGVSGGMSAHADASDGLGGSLAVDATSENSSINDELGQDQTFYRLQRVSLAGGSAQVTANGTLNAMADNELSPLTPVNLDYPGTIPGDLVRGTLSEASAALEGTIKVDDREVYITSDFDPTYHRDKSTHALVANVRQSDGSMTGDITAPPPGGTAATYHAVLSGSWGQDSSYAWAASLLEADRTVPVTAHLSSGRFNSPSIFGTTPQAVPDFPGFYYNPPASDGASDVVTLTLTDGGDGATAKNTYTMRFHHPHAVPVNFRCTSVSTTGDGVLHYEYGWDSSTGNIADLADVTVKEKVNYDGNSTGIYVTFNGIPLYVTPPPFTNTFANPQVYGGTPGTDGFLDDYHEVTGTSPLYQPANYKANQYYIYTDETMDPSDLDAYAVLKGPIDIDRAVLALNGTWYYDIIKFDAPPGNSAAFGEARLPLGPVQP